MIGAYLTFRIARRAGSAYLSSKFGNRKLDATLSFFHRWGTSALAAYKAVPFPFPTSVFFEAAGVSNYSIGRFLPVVTICRAGRYGIIAIIADHYGRISSAFCAIPASIGAGCCCSRLSSSA